MNRPFRLCTAWLILLLHVPVTADEWPQWRGPRRDGVSDSKGLLRQWPEQGPPVRWRVDTVGVGYSSVAVAGDRIYTQGDLQGVEHVLALRADDGSVVWQVQPAPVAELLGDRVASELKRLDRNGDGQVDEWEALSGLGWDFTRYDRPQEGAAESLEALAARRVEALFARLDEDNSGRLSGEEALKAFRDPRRVASIDQADEEADVDELARRRAQAALDALDQDGDRKLSKEETRGSAAGRWFDRADERLPNERRGDGQLTLDEVTAYLAAEEKGKDGELTPDELRRYYVAERLLGDGQLTADELRGMYGGYRNGMGDGPRGTPTVDENRVYVEGGNGDVTCLDAATGRTLWHTNLSRDHGGGRPGWGYSESPLIEGRMVIVTPGGKQGTLVALDKMTGEVIWRTAQEQQGAHYSSPVAADICGTRQIVQFARESVFGVLAETGQVLWRYSAANNGTANCATPIVYQDHVFVSSAYGTGGGLARISVQGDQQTAEEVYFDNRMANHHGGIVRVGDFMYGFGNGGLICMHFLTGKVAWRDRSVGKGSLIAGDGLLFLLSENHSLALADASPEAYREHGRLALEKQGRPSWAHPALADGVLYIRDQQTLTAYEVRDRQ